MDQPLPSIRGLHPGIAVTGFCPACLRPPASLPNSTDLRHCKSFSYGRSAAAYLNPQRRSCDARGALFHQEPSCVPEEGEQQIRAFGFTGRRMKDHISQESSSSRTWPGPLGSWASDGRNGAARTSSRSSLKGRGPPPAGQPCRQRIPAGTSTTASGTRSRRSPSNANELSRTIAGANASARVSPAIRAEFYH